MDSPKTLARVEVKENGDTFNVKAYEKAVKSYITKRKPLGEALDEEIMDELSVKFGIVDDALEDLFKQIQDAGISIVDKDGNPSPLALVTDEIEKKKFQILQWMKLLRMFVSMILFACILKKSVVIH